MAAFWTWCDPSSGMVSVRAWSVPSTRKDCPSREWPSGLKRDVPPHQGERGVALTGDAHQHLQRLVLLGGGDDRDVLLDDAGLLSGDLRQRVAQHRHVVIGERRDHRDQGHHDIGGIQATSEAHLDHGHIDLLLGEVQQPQRRRDLKRRQLRYARHSRFGKLDETDKLVVRHRAGR